MTELKSFLFEKNNFWIKFQQIVHQYANDEGDNILPELTVYVELFKTLLQKVQPWIETKSKEKNERNVLLVQAALLLEMPATVNDVFVKIYQKSFNAFKSLNKDEFFEIKDHSMIDEDEEDIMCFSCSQEKVKCSCQDILEQFLVLNNTFSQLGLIEHVASPAIISVVYNQLTDFIEKHCKGEFLEPWLDRVLTWMSSGLITWLEFAANSHISTKVNSSSFCLTVDQWRQRFSYFMHKVLAELRISEMFEIIVEYPDSLPAINDLKECMLKTEARQLLTTSLRQSFEGRLLHPAVNTDDILTQYVSAIRTLRELDPAGVILENVCAPLRDYLRSREDTIKCIITCLTDQESGLEDLFGTNIDLDNEKRDEDESDGEDWLPDPIDAKSDMSSKSQRNADIINILVNIYGSKDMFVSQYRILLADRILTNFTYDVTNERRYLELLKHRFGESHLHYCDIMLKDIQDSHRINRLIKDEIGKKKSEILNKQEGSKGETNTFETAVDEIEFNAFILSSAFWPALADDSVELPEHIKILTDHYTEVFKRHKGMRTLDWFSNLGSVELEVELDDGLKSFNATPPQATLLIKFQEKGEWSLADLANELNITKTAVRSRISFWVGQGVIVERLNDTFVAAQSFQSNIHEALLYDSDDDTATTSTQNQKDEELQVYWSYVTGMLTNLGSLPLTRIHSMLKMFATHGDSSSQCTPDEVKAFLQTKVNDGELLYVGGMYKMPKT